MATEDIAGSDQAKNDAGDLLDPQEIRASILYLLRGQRADGCIPDRVNAEGQAIYSPGGEQAPLADHALDNGPFLAMLVCNYLDLTEDAGFFSQVEPAVRRGLDHTRRDDSGLVFTTSKEPQCPYGFTDNDSIMQCGQVRHLPAGQTWQRFFTEGGVEKGTYQNGAFWATPLAWVVPTIAR